MHAGTTTIDQAPVDAALETTAKLERSAEQGNWDRVEELSQRLRHIVAGVPEQDRRRVLLAAQQSMAKAQQLAAAARNHVTEKLSKIRRGRDAAKAYGNAY